MSKKKPEIGDVWVNVSGSVVHIVEIDEDERVCGYLKDCRTTVLYDPNVEFKYLLVYIGKAKAKVNDLFEVVE